MPEGKRGEEFQAPWIAELIFITAWNSLSRFYPSGLGFQDSLDDFPVRVPTRSRSYPDVSSSESLVGSESPSLGQEYESVDGLSGYPTRLEPHRQREQRKKIKKQRASRALRAIRKFLALCIFIHSFLSLSRGGGSYTVSSGGGTGIPGRVTPYRRPWRAESLGSRHLQTQYKRSRKDHRCRSQE